jgi:hypothetical protein
MAANQISSENPEVVYSQLSQDQRAAIAREFMQGFQQSGNPKAQQFTSLNPDTVTPQQLAAMHQHARDEHPGLLGRVMRHPIAAAALGALPLMRSTGTSLAARRSRSISLLKQQPEFAPAAVSFPLFISCFALATRQRLPPCKEALTFCYGVETTTMLMKS